MLFVQFLHVAAMRDSAQISSFSGQRSSTGRNSSPVQYPPIYETTIYLWEYQPYFDIDCFSRLVFVRAALTVLFDVGVSDTAVETWRKC